MCFYLKSNVILSHDGKISILNDNTHIHFVIDVDSNRIKLLPHWRLEVRKTPEDRNTQNGSCHVTEAEYGDDSSIAPRYN